MEVATMSQELLIAASALVGLLVIAGALLKGWQDWLALKQRELEAGRAPREIEGGLRCRADILEEYECLDPDGRYRLLIELGRELEEMPQALKTDATLVRGCSASVWVYPTEQQGKLHFLADSNAAITKGIVGLVL